MGAEEELTFVTKKESARSIKPERTENLFVDFVQALQEGRSSRIPAEDCFSVTEVVLKARQAADDHKLLELKATA